VCHTYTVFLICRESECNNCLNYSHLFFNGPAFSLFEKLILDKLKKLNTCDSEIFDSIKNLFNLYKVPFKGLDSEFLAFEHFKKNKTFLEPQSVSIGRREAFRTVDGVSKVRIIDATAEFIPISIILKNFFEMSSVLKDTILFMKILEDEAKNTNVIRNIIQGKFWRDVEISVNDRGLILPLIIHYDDYQTNNPSSSHKNKAKCGAVYCSIPCLPPSMQAKN